MFKSKLFAVVALLFIFLLCLCATTVGVVLYARSSNTNVPVASDLAEKIENAFVTEEAFDQVVIEELTKYLENPEAYIAQVSNQSFKSKLTSVVKTMTEGQTITLNGSGSMEVDYENKSSAISSDLNMDIADIKLSTTIDVKSFQSNDKADLYIKFSSIPSFLTSFVPGIDQIAEKWMYLEAPIDQVAMESLENKDEVLEVIKSKEFLSLVNKAPGRVVNNVRAVCVSIKANDKQIMSLANKYADVTGEESQVSAKDLDGMNVNIEICTGRGDSELHYVNFEIGSEAFDMNIKLDDFVYSGDISIEKPKADLNLMDLIPTAMPTP